MGKLETAVHKTDEKADRIQGPNRQESKREKEKLNQDDQRQPVLSESPFYPQREYHARFLAGRLPGNQQADMVLRLQQTYGNAYVQRLLASMAVQAKLTVSSPEDAYEQEADRVAETVSRLVNSQARPQTGKEEAKIQPAEIQAESQAQRQAPEEEEGVYACKEPLAESINSMELQQGEQAMLQRGIWGDLKKFVGGVFKRKKQPEPELTDEQAARLLAELQEEVNKESEEVKPPEEELTEEDERMLAELEQEGEKKPEKELSEEESAKQLAELESHLEEEPKEDMSPQELDGEIDRLMEMTDVLSEKFNVLLNRQGNLAKKYAQLVIKEKDAEAEKVLKESQGVIEQREQIEEELQEAFTRLTKLQSMKQDKISELISGTIGPELSEKEQQEIGREMEEIEEHSPEQEERQAEIEERIMPESSQAVAPGIQETAPGTSLKPELIKEDPLDWLTKRELSPEEEAAMEEDLAEIERQFASEKEMEELLRILNAIGVPNTKLEKKSGKTEEEAEVEQEETGRSREAVIAMKSDEQSPIEVPVDLEREIMAAGGGQPLSRDVRLPMEEAFGTDFSGVTVHTDSEAHGLNESLQARAFTRGQDIFFRNGEYNPGSESGQKLIAHELTHVVQQSGNIARRKNNAPE